MNNQVKLPIAAELRGITIKINPRHLPLWIERLANEGYTVNIQYSKKLVKITCEGYTLRNLMPFGQTRLNEFGG